MFKKNIAANLNTECGNLQKNGRVVVLCKKMKNNSLILGSAAGENNDITKLHQEVEQHKKALDDKDQLIEKLVSISCSIIINLRIWVFCGTNVYCIPC